MIEVDVIAVNNLNLGALPFSYTSDISTDSSGYLEMEF